MDVECAVDGDVSFEIQLSGDYANASVQTDQIKSLPCSVCIRNDVSLHPAVQFGIVDLEFASAFMPDAYTALTNENGPTQKRARRDCSKGRCITSGSEIQRLESQRKAEREKESKKIQKQEEKKRREEEKKRLSIIAEKEKETKRLRDEKIEKISKIGKISKHRVCVTCSKKVSNTDIVKCVLCQKRVHRECTGEQSIINTICPVCTFVSNEHHE